MAGPNDKQTKDVQLEPVTREAPVRSESKTLSPDIVLARRDGARSNSRLAALPKHVDIGKVKVGTATTFEIPLIVTDGFVGLGVATPKVEDLIRGGDDKAFTLSSMEVSYSAFSRAETLKFQVSPLHNGSVYGALSVAVAWSDGTISRISTRLNADGVGEEPTDAPKEQDTRNGVKELYDNTRLARLSLLMNGHEAISAVQKNFDTMDAPSIKEKIIEVAYDFSLGLISGGLSYRLADWIGKRPTTGTVKQIAEHAKNGWQTAFDDGFKSGVQFGRAVLRGDGDDSLARANYFGSQRKALTEAHLDIGKRDNALERRAMDSIDEATKEQRSDIIQGESLAARDHLAAVTATKPSVEPLHYKASLTGWMQAQARDEFGASKNPDTPGVDLSDAVDTNPTNFYKKDGANGVIYVAFGTRRDRPFSGRVKVAGITKAALDPIRKAHIKELKMPIVVTGYAVDGLLDSVNNSNNEVAFGKNEAGTVFWKGHENALDVLVAGSRAQNIEGAVKEIIRDDIETMTLEGADNRQ